MTPEGRIKQMVSKELSSYKSRVYYHMPVLSGYGKPSLDYIGCVNGKFFAVETKAPGKKMTARQNKTTRDIELAGGTVFVVDSAESMTPLSLFIIKALNNSEG